MPPPPSRLGNHRAPRFFPTPFQHPGPSARDLRPLLQMLRTFQAPASSSGSCQRRGYNIWRAAQLPLPGIGWAQTQGALLNGTEREGDAVLPGRDDGSCSSGRRPGSAGWRAPLAESNWKGGPASQEAQPGSLGRGRRPPANSDGAPPEGEGAAGRAPLPPTLQTPVRALRPRECPAGPADALGAPTHPISRHLSPGAKLGGESAPAGRVSSSPPRSSPASAGRVPTSHIQLPGERVLSPPHPGSPRRRPPAWLQALRCAALCPGPGSASGSPPGRSAPSGRAGWAREGRQAGSGGSSGSSHLLRPQPPPTRGAERSRQHAAAAAGRRGQGRTVPRRALRLRAILSRRPRRGEAGKFPAVGVVMGGGGGQAALLRGTGRVPSPGRCARAESETGSRLVGRQGCEWLITYIRLNPLWKRKA